MLIPASTPVLLRAGTLLVLAVGVSPAGTRPIPRQQGLAPDWYDGRAEVSGYRWRGSRYGEERTGAAVAIFVTEPFSEALHVKVDRPDGIEGEVITALKLNLVRDFQAGIYDYNTMTSVFVDVDGLDLLKSTFSSAEWCGHVFEEIDLRAGKATLVTNSYFQGESGTRTLPAEPGGLIGDQLLVWLRGLNGAPLEPGESKLVPFLAGSFERRMLHQAASWQLAKIERAPSVESVTVPAGTFDAIPYRMDVGDRHGASLGRVCVVHVEAAPPHRLLAWKWTIGDMLLDSGELTGSERLKYWE